MMTTDGQVRCLKWHDKRDVNMLSTYHTDELIEDQGEQLEVLKL